MKTRIDIITSNGDTYATASAAGQPPRTFYGYGGELNAVHTAANEYGPDSEEFRRAARAFCRGVEDTSSWDEIDRDEYRAIIRPDYSTACDRSIFHMTRDI